MGTAQLSRERPARRRRGRQALALALCAALVAPLGAGAATGERPHADTLFDVETLLSLAEQGDARACFLLGTRYASGRGGIRDDSEAARWFAKAAQLGLAEAQYNLGIMYASGRGVARDLPEAASWYRAAAEQGLAAAQYNLGTLYGRGEGVPRDEAAAARWLTRAAEQGLAEAQYNLGVLYEHGRGVRLDAGQATQWYERAAGQGFEPAAKRLAALREKLARPAPTAQAPAGEWLRSRRADHYTLQLASLQSPAQAQAFMDRHALGEQAAQFASRKDGTTWYSVVWGDFGSYEAAQQAVAGLPPGLHDVKPWIRRFGDIQGAMLGP